jgi:GT2 family glycosyltransferase
LPGEAPPRASVVIPTWNGRDLLLHALAALERQTFGDFEVVVVDNASTDGTAEAVRARHSHVRIVALPQNVGFAAGVNRGIEASRGEVVVLLNNDTEAAPGWLAALVEAMDADPSLGSAASKVMMYHDRTRVDSAGDRVGLFASQVANGMVDGPALSVPRPVLSACAAAAAYRREVFDAVGLFDESFFAYFEDVDLGLRARIAGFGCTFVPGAVVYHHASATSNRMPARKFHLVRRNALHLFVRYAPLPRLLLFGPAMLLWPVIRAPAEGQTFAAGFRVLADFSRGLGRSLRLRRDVWRRARITRRQFARLLSPPLTRQGDAGFPAEEG